LVSDPKDFGRRTFLGALNSYLATKNLDDQHELKYDAKTWKNGEELIHIFLDLAIKARVEEKDYWKAICLLNIVQALDAEPSQHVCNPTCKKTPSPNGLICVPEEQLGPNPALSLLLGFYEHAFQCTAYSDLQYGNLLNLVRLQPSQYQPDAYMGVLGNILQAMIAFKGLAFSFAHHRVESIEEFMLPMYIEKMNEWPPETRGLAAKLTNLLNQVKKGIQGKTVRPFLVQLQFRRP